MTEPAVAQKLAIFVVGTRAQLIKVAPVIVACQDKSQPLLLLLTGQHKETMDDLITEFGIISRQEHAFAAIERSTVFSLLRWIPQAYLALSRRLKSLASDHTSVVVVHGDTVSTVLGALAARRRGLRVFHLESGLTSGKVLDPFPEELSRRIVFRLTDVALCPSWESATHMRAHYRCRVVDTGQNTIVDSVMIATRNVAAPLEFPDEQPAYFVASLHRFQNIFDAKRLGWLVAFLVELGESYPIHFVLHPATRKRLMAAGLLDRLGDSPGIQLSPRLGYRQFLSLASKATCVLTDGGSNQEELAVLGVPTIVMRQTTERADGLGENAIMEGSLQEALLSYCTSGRFNSLRRPSRVASKMGPSALVADVLMTS